MRVLNPVYIILFLLLTFVLAGRPAQAEEGACSAEGLLLDLVNGARMQPEATLLRHGLNPAALVARMPETAPYLKTGMMPLVSDEQITAAAAAHLEDMRLGGYYASQSLDGRLPYDRLVEQGYLPAEVKESLSMLGFRNFVDPCRAVELVFANMLRDEMVATTTDDLKILSPDLREAGFAVGSGTIRSGLLVYHYYHVVCDLAVSALSGAERQVLDAVSAARENPLAYAESAGIDLGPYLDADPNLADELASAPPIPRPDATLTDAARAVGEDMVAGGVVGTEETLMGLGLAPDEVAAVSRMTITVDAGDPLAGALQHVARIFTRELSLPVEARSILNGDFDRVGLHLRAVAPGEWIGDDGLPSPHYNVILVMVFGRAVP